MTMISSDQTPTAIGCIGNTIRVAGGHYVDLSEPKPDTIDIISIAAGLSKFCRYGGQCPRFYSVAEHSLLCTELAIRDGADPESVKAVFLHDAAEAYIGDVVKPLKIMLPDYAAIEERMEKAIAERFQVDFEALHSLIKRYDYALLKQEKLTMWPEDKGTHPGFDTIEDRAIELRFWTSDEAERRFLQMAIKLKVI